MKRIVLIIVSLAAPVLSAQAGQQVSMSSDDCRRLLKHEPAADVAFEPGVDVRGKKVKGADMEDRPPVAVSKIFEFNITRDFSAYGGATDTPVGAVRYDASSGRLTFNDQPLIDADKAELTAACRQSLQKGR
ncbi:MAG: hypothetical protein A3G18_09625 [Rhodospirillales bacterium RIFCSPLOWO2_12_FULL_58_28]|nr:MAG: hypothetical protein A3H92_02050 [Rhodospirillales bacterium RIFCSPLOWO2_02_FULL_58_16]OHC76761.1 MAG: hypothetical protein A3G18_09625 [Rhodospirillales bacterium RIFCSPLOWO2_12_FULL_58_28]